MCGLRFFFFFSSNYGYLIVIVFEGALHNLGCFYAIHVYSYTVYCLKTVTPESRANNLTVF